MNLESVNIGILQENANHSLVVKHSRVTRSKIIEKTEEGIKRGIE